MFDNEDVSESPLDTILRAGDQIGLRSYLDCLKQYPNLNVIGPKAWAWGAQPSAAAGALLFEMHQTMYNDPPGRVLKVVLRSLPRKVHRSPSYISFVSSLLLHARATPDLVGPEDARHVIHGLYAFMLEQERRPCAHTDFDLFYDILRRSYPLSNALALFQEELDNNNPDFEPIAMLLAIYDWDCLPDLAPIISKNRIDQKFYKEMPRNTLLLDTLCHGSAHQKLELFAAINLPAHRHLAPADLYDLFVQTMPK